MSDAAANPALHKLCCQILLYLRRPDPLEIQDLAQRIGATPAMVIQAIDHLGQHGCRFETTPHGVQLLWTGWPWWRELLESSAQTSGRILGRHVLVFEKTASTNDVAAHAAKSTGEPLVVLADVQTHGRGRWSNRWISAAGQSVLLSVLLPNQKPNGDCLSLAVALAVAQTIERLIHQEVHLKWPNDILIDGKKVAGILIETRPQANDSAAPALMHQIIGIGINVLQNANDFPAPIAAEAASLNMVCPKNWDRLDVIDDLLISMERNCLPLPDPQQTIEQWKSRCTILGQPIRVNCRGTVLEGSVADIDPMNGLILRDNSDTMHMCKAQETTVLGEDPL
jgi:BirA family transcriptional regulator, biotin operon repressor / biotin---[acetyl-CoA-carboxylase] ligase